YLSEPIPWITLDKGPWMKPTVGKTSTKLNVKLLSHAQELTGRSTIKFAVQNNGKIPAFMVKADIESVKRVFFASDNYFWLAPGEEKEITMVVQWREEIVEKKPKLTVGAWNAKTRSMSLSMN